MNSENLRHAQNLSDAFHNVAEALRPCVVSISTKQSVVDPRVNRVPPQFRWQFGPREQNGMGSGVIVRSDGYILTNNHVIEGADSLTVELPDGQTVAGTVVGADPQTDLAVVKIDAPNLRAAAFGDSDATRVGDWVLAIGSPSVSTRPSLPASSVERIVSKRSLQMVMGLKIFCKLMLQSIPATLEVRWSICAAN